ncbi:MAG: hypothetical protein ACI4QA_03720 [Candidatus Spyradosoma sp.]
MTAAFTQTQKTLAAAATLAAALFPAAEAAPRPDAGTTDAAAEAVRAAEQKTRDAELLEIARAQRKTLAEIRDAKLSDLERSRRLSAVAARYENFLARFPGDARALVLSAKFLREGGEDDAARERLEKAAALRPDWAVVRQQLGAIAAERGDFAAAARRLREAVELDPGTAEYQTQLGEILRLFRAELLGAGVFADAGALDAAMQNAFRAARALKPDALDEAVRYAESFYDVAEPDFAAALDAWTLAKTLAARAPELGAADSDARKFVAETLELHRARAFAELGRFAEAEEILRAGADPRLERSRGRVREILSEKRKTVSEKP